VDPADAAAGLLERLRAPLERLLAPGADGHVAHARQLRLGELQAVARVVAPAAQEDGLALPRLDLHPEEVDEEGQALVGKRCEQLRVPDVHEIADGLAHLSTRSRRLSRS